MDRDELVERVAEALSVDQHARHHLRPVEWADHTNIWRDECRSRARAALAIIEPRVREECARVVQRKAAELRADDAEWGGPPTAGSAVISPVLDRIAAAIRAGGKV